MINILIIVVIIMIILLKINKTIYNIIQINNIIIGIYVLNHINNEENQQMMVILVIIITSIVVKFTEYYMREDPKILKFYCYLNIFSMSMINIVENNNLIKLLIGWELVGISSYLLISFWYERNQANKGGIKAIMYNKIGDIFLLLFIWLIYKYNNNINLEYIQLNKNIEIISIIILIVCMTKSGQIIFHVWLPEAMEGPTPVSALLHAATMVTAGVIIMIKMKIIIIKIKIIIIIIGILTSIIGGYTSILSTDIKKIIANSTTSQLGLMFILIGINENLSFQLLFSHAWYKALIFIIVGYIIHELNDNQDIRLIKNIGVDTNIFVYYGSIILIGFPYYSGYISKEYIMITLGENKILIMLIIINSILTYIYSIKLVYWIIINTTSYNKNYNKENINYLKILLIISMIVGYMSNIYYINNIIIDTYNQPNIYTIIVIILVIITINLNINKIITKYYYDKIINNILIKYNNIYKIIDQGILTKIII